jgi:hypothetical protein
LLKASKSETIEYRRRKGPNDDVAVLIQITKQEEVLMPFALHRFFTCSKPKALSSSAFETEYYPLNGYLDQYIRNPLSVNQ